MGEMEEDSENLNKFENPLRKRNFSADGDHGSRESTKRRKLNETLEVEEEKSENPEVSNEVKVDVDLLTTAKNSDDYLNESISVFKIRKRRGLKRKKEIFEKIAVKKVRKDKSLTP